MSKTALATFQDKRILLLQGPVGPFFKRLRDDLERSSAAGIYKINFNGGDWLFYPRNSLQFRGTLDEWPIYLSELLENLRIDALMLFGDCREYHKRAIQIAAARKIEVRVFEEGYFRPDYITFESQGVNGFSSLPKEPLYYRNFSFIEHEKPRRVGNAFWHTALWAILYYLASSCLSPWFRTYRHHRPLGLTEGVYWLRSFLRKLTCKISERKIRSELLEKRRIKFFLVPLQTHSDHQVGVHSGYASIEEFIRQVLGSFAAHAPRDASIVFKHHPLDRGYRDYSALIRRLGAEYALGTRALYVHDLHLPSLLKNSLGVVVINSTAGLSALFHDKPVKACGRAVYDIHGLTYQKSLDCFWNDAPSFNIDRRLFRLFRHYLLKHTQINGSFYKKLAGSACASGISWSASPAKETLTSTFENEMEVEVANSKFR